MPLKPNQKQWMPLFYCSKQTHFIFILTFLGIGFSLLACAIWPMVSLIVPLHRQGTAFGEFQIVIISPKTQIIICLLLLADNYQYQFSP